MGTARRIRDKMKSAGFSNYEIGPWWAFFLFGNDGFMGFFGGTSDITLNVIVYIIDVLVVAILVLGIISMFAMYSTDGGEFKYHTNSHILRFFVFFGMFFIVSFISIRFWHETSYIAYFVIFLLLLGVKYFGLK